MNLSTASRTLQLLGRVADVRTATEPFLAPDGDKPALPLRPAQQPFPRVSPEEEGVSSRHLKKFLEELAAGRDLYMQDVMVLRHGKVLCEAAFGGQDLRCPKYTFSACKSVTSLAIGLLVDDGLLSLDEKVVDIFDDIAPQATKRRLKNLSVEHLLTMRSSVVFSEPEALTEEDWPRRFLGSAQKGEPGGGIRLQQPQHLYALRHHPPKDRPGDDGAAPGAALRAYGHHRHPVGKMPPGH